MHQIMYSLVTALYIDMLDIFITSQKELDSKRTSERCPRLYDIASFAMLRRRSAGADEGRVCVEHNEELSHFRVPFENSKISEIIKKTICTFLFNRTDCRHGIPGTIEKRTKKREKADRALNEALFPSRS